MAAILLAFLLVALAGPRFMGSITSGMGIVDFPFASSFWQSVLVYALLLGAALLSTYWASDSLKRISPRMLVNE